jgi:hypothetical protein
MYDPKSMTERFIAECKEDPNVFFEYMERYERKFPNDYKKFMNKIGERISEKKSEQMYGKEAA